ncbi:hypothetical protein BJ508DRAFT_416994 [Ascobolus immersus RN42]|uniref:RRM domain-containing protein n=1 Tax=Ascobolus immersus RN42 TaxID=1160509 RepID=A0A3N4HX15_ASCIM|nr:hypothetical protein BJ508DRAFT_416994 [Ascobolus immersus RN42]
MGDRMDVDGGNKISLDGILQAERRKQARNANSGAGRGRGGRDGRSKLRNGGTNTPPVGDSNGKWKHDLFSAKGVPNPMASRVSKTPVGGKSSNGKAIAINPKVAKELAGNPLFAAIAGTNSPKNNNGGKPVTKVPSLTELQKNKSIDIGASIRGAATGPQKEIPRGPAADRRNNNGFNNNGFNNNSGFGNNSVNNTGFGNNVKIPTGPANPGTSIRGAAGLNIRGAAGPFVVRIANLAQGTTSDDILSVMKTIGKIRSVTITKVSPLTSAEILFEKRDAALACVQKYNGLKADGHNLRVSLHDGPPTQPQTTSTADRDNAYAVQREMANLQRLQANQAMVQDGTHGFPAQPLLYSDALIKRGRGFQR